MSAARSILAAVTVILSPACIVKLPFGIVTVSPLSTAHMSTRRPSMPEASYSFFPSSGLPSVIFISTSSTRPLYYAVDLVRRRMLGVDRHREPEVIAQKIRVL